MPVGSRNQHKDYN